LIDWKADDDNKLLKDKRARAAMAIRIEILADENCCTSGIHVLAKNAQ
jgi:hypothetical protein